MSKKFIAMLLAVALSAGVLAGCAGGNAQKGDTESTASKADTTVSSKEPENFNKEGYPIVNEKITFKVMTHLDNLDQLAWTKKMEEVTNIKMDWIVQTDWETQTNLALAGGNLPDMFLRVLPAGSVEKYGAAGTFVDLSQKLEYMPNMAGWLEEDPTIRKAIENTDGKIYTMPYIQKTATASLGTVYTRMDMLKKVGKAKPTTIDEFYDTLVALKNGGFGKDFVPFLPDTGAINYHVEHFLFPAFGDSVDVLFGADKDNKVVYNPTSEQFKHYIEFVRKLYEEKLLDNEAYTRDEASAKAKVMENKAGFVTYGTCLMPDNFESGKVELELLAPLTSQYTTEKKIVGDIYGSASGGIITNKCKNVEALLRWMDIGYAKEDVAPGLNHLSMWLGIRGETWDYTDDTHKYYEIIKPEGYTKSDYEFLSEQVAPGGYINANVLNALMISSPGLLIKGEQTIANLFPYQKPPFPDVLLKQTDEENAAIAQAYTDIETYTSQMKAKFIVGEEPLSKWDEYVAQINKMGIDKVLAAKQAAYDRYLK